MSRLGRQAPAVAFRCRARPRRRGRLVRGVARAPGPPPHDGATPVLSRGSLLIDFAESAELRAANVAWVGVVALSTRLLRRAPDTAGFDFWVQRRRAGGDVGSLAAVLVLR